MRAGLRANPRPANQRSADDTLVRHLKSGVTNDLLQVEWSPLNRAFKVPGTVGLTLKEYAMHYLFLDESYSGTPANTIVSVAAWIVEQRAFDDFVSRRQELYRTPVLDSINSMLEGLDGWAVVSRGSFDQNTYRKGERDSTDDIVEVARPDNVWSQCVIFTIGILIRELIKRNIDVGLLDMYHDPKALKSDHAAALGQTLRDSLVSLVRQFTSDRKILVMKDLNIRRIEAIEKPVSDPPVIYQIGTWVADKLCALAYRSESREYSRVIRRDVSDLVRRTVQQFDGKPFHSD